jgi:hypothetical protein
MAQRGAQRTILKILAARKLTVTDRVRERVAACTDAAALDRLAERAATATSLDHLFDD